MSRNKAHSLASSELLAMTFRTLATVSSVGGALSGISCRIASLWVKYLWDNSFTFLAGCEYLEQVALQGICSTALHSRKRVGKSLAYGQGTVVVERVPS
jgi:hypothetical protein